ncbi:stomatin-like protein 1 isoform X2 [Watersipora subatra]|uniref:stomatin-like protein 1 isoform X2 n=1 Tax=Watersipora subatra TaxID=2589382 RepID=UPI00355C7A5C
MMTSVKYSQIGQNESETTIFDYSSPFTYHSTNPKDYHSIFEYRKPLMPADFDIQGERGLGRKTVGVKILYWSAVTIFALLIILTLPVSVWFVIKKVKDDEQLVQSRLGIIKCVRGPTLTMVIPCVDRTTLYSTSLREFNIPPQKALTSDGLLVELGGILRYRIIDAEKTCFAAQDIYHTMRVTAQTLTSKYIRSTREKDLTETASVQAINSELKDELQKTFLPWGVAVNSFEITGLKGIMRVEQEDAISQVIGPIKQWLFADQQTDPSVSSSPMGQFANMFASMAPALPTSSRENHPVPDTTTQASSLASLSHTLTPKDLLTAVKAISNKQLVQRVGTVYKFIVEGDDPGVYYMDLKHGDGDCGSGEPPAGPADTCITVSLADMQRMFTGSLAPFNAYMSGVLQISGDISGAMKLDELVKSIASVSATTDS